MKLLLDTHVLIWLVEGSENLSNAAKQAIEDDDNSLSGSGVKTPHFRAALPEQTEFCWSGNPPSSQYAL